MSTLWLACMLLLLVLSASLSLLVVYFWRYCRHLRQAQYDLHHAGLQIEEDNRQLMAMLSHELRSPMAAISNAAAVIDLALSQEQPEHIPEMTHNIRQGLARLTRIVDNLAVDDRLAQWKTQTPRTLALDTHLHSLLEQIRQIHPTCQIQLQLHGPQISVTLPAPDMFDTLLMHLLDNAVKYAPASCPIELNVTIKPHSALVVDVADQGPGLEPALRARLFNKYIRGRQTGSTGGTGLGLFLVKYIVDTFGGTIQVLDREGGGTCFRVELPLFPVEDKHERKPPSGIDRG